jgi:ribosomal protein S18 acetylase RimI-like enzyme
VRAIRRLRDEPADVALGTELVHEYVVATALETGLDVDLILPLIRELHDFAGHYLRGGAFLVATSDDTVEGAVEGAVGVTPGAGGTCEMNRLWARPGHRRAGLGRALCEASMAAARDLGFRRMILEVLPERTAAIRLYRSLGFVDAPPAHEYPFPMVPLGRDL